MLSLENGFLISISLEQNHSSLEMNVLMENGDLRKVTAFNQDGAPIKIALGAISLCAGLQNHANRPTLGEIEGVTHANGVLVIEGDFGDITIYASHLELQAVK